MAKTFSDIMSRSGFATHDLSEPRTMFEYEESPVKNAEGETLRVNAVNQGLLPHAAEQIIEPTVQVSSRENIEQIGVPQPDAVDRYREELKRVDVKDNELVNANEKKVKAANLSAFDLNQVVDE